LKLQAQDLTVLRPQLPSQHAAAIDVSADCETNDYESAPLPARQPSEQGATGLSGCQVTTPRSILHQHYATSPKRMSHGIDRLENAIGRGYNINLMTTTAAIGAAA